VNDTCWQDIQGLNTKVCMKIKRPCPHSQDQSHSLESLTVYAHLGDHSIQEANTGNAGQQFHKLVWVTFKLEVDRRRVHDGAHKVTLSCWEACAYHHSQHVLITEVSCLDHVCPTEKNMPSMILGIKWNVWVWQWCLRHRHTLTWTIRVFFRDSHKIPILMAGEKLNCQYEPL